VYRRRLRFDLLLILLLFLLLQPLLGLLLGNVVSDDATGNRTSDGMVTCDMSCHTPDDGALDTALRIGGAWSSQDDENHDGGRE